jgi:hypothetical protein
MILKECIDVGRLMTNLTLIYGALELLQELTDEQLSVELPWEFRLRVRQVHEGHVAQARLIYFLETAI